MIVSWSAGLVYNRTNQAGKSRTSLLTLVKASRCQHALAEVGDRCCWIWAPFLVHFPSEVSGWCLGGRERVPGCNPG
jgi:hypothetical protein